MKSITELISAITNEENDEAKVQIFVSDDGYRYSIEPSSRHHDEIAVYREDSMPTVAEFFSPIAEELLAGDIEKACHNDRMPIANIWPAVDKYVEQIEIAELHDDRIVKLIVDVEDTEDPYVFCDWNLKGDWTEYHDGTFLVDVTPVAEMRKDHEAIVSGVRAYLEAHVEELKARCEIENDGSTLPLILDELI